MPVAHPGRARAVGHPVRLGWDWDVGHDLPAARSMRVTVRASWLATHSDPPPTARLCGLAPVLTGQWLADGRVGRGIDPNHRAVGVHPQEPVGCGHAGTPGRGMTAANCSRTKAGTAAPVPVSAGGWVDRGVLPVSASPEHPAAASSTPMTNVFCQRPARSGDGPRLAGVGMAHLPSQGSRVGHPSYTGCAWPVPLEWKVSAGPRLPGVAPQP